LFARPAITSTLLVNNDVVDARRPEPHSHMNLPLQSCIVRSWTLGDVSSLVANANNREIWINVRDRFPHPYTARDGREFIRSARRMQPETFFAIEVDRAAVGGIGFVLQADVERVSAEIGYWLGQAFWGRGIATEAVVHVTRYAIERHGLTRVFALPFAYNIASCRVLEKAGYVLEARLRRSAIKGGRIVDQMQYAFVVEE
jgi:ribosomal-protein-alanine N-acetyltransferase